MGETTSLSVLRQFCKWIWEIFGGEFLRKPTPDESETARYALFDPRVPRNVMKHRLHALGVEELSRGLERLVHNWIQKQTSIDDSGGTVPWPAIADYRLRIWHAYFGVAGSNNDINVLQSSLLFNDDCRGEGLKISFVANDTQYSRGYYLTDEIYLWWLWRNGLEQFSLCLHARKSRNVIKTESSATAPSINRLDW
ncbi:uncharacterized protein LOC121745926 [Salvia splendens]|uniref:uncharacterized protein LOC121745926 n=1 Tax=Salvia splendens TaxID=180675 RepID=UPI001C26D810|nr:uncharacterized protein LOC121745926 [Salvia splendens]